MDPPGGGPGPPRPAPSPVQNIAPTPQEGYVALSSLPPTSGSAFPDTVRPIRASGASFQASLLLQIPCRRHIYSRFMSLTSCVSLSLVWNVNHFHLMRAVLFPYFRSTPLSSKRPWLFRSVTAQLPYPLQIPGLLLLRLRSRSVTTHFWPLFLGDLERTPIHSTTRRTSTLLQQWCRMSTKPEQTPNHAQCRRINLVRLLHSRFRTRLLEIFSVNSKKPFR